MLHSETFANVAGALAAAQGEFPLIPKDRKVKVRSKKTYSDGTPIEYEFWYAPLDTILGCVRPALAKNNLALIQSVIVNPDKSESVRTVLAHSSGEWVANDVPLFTGAGDNASQAYASGMTYARRYGVNTILCIAADDDDDSNGNEGGQRSASTRPAGSGAKQGAKPAAKPAPANDPNDTRVGIYDLSESQKRLLLAKAKSQGLDEDGLVQKWTLITPVNLNAVLDSLKSA